MLECRVVGACTRAHPVPKRRECSLLTVSHLVLSSHPLETKMLLLRCLATALQRPDIP